jgi:hypothetical protein
MLYVLSSLLCKDDSWSSLNVFNFLLFSRVVWDRARLVRRPLVGVLSQPRMIDEPGSVGKMVIWQKTLEMLGEIFPQFFSVRHKIHMTWAGIESEPSK